ncbi:MULTISPECIES: type II toxin-antitoxin system VapC family toxin [unclassified Halomonas]|uniref:type II toxin-antitoxin system VapC family toxin n=1 Tax=unclassified Halomonas TaxID=2609666 RepID=UPI003F8FC910
MSILPDTSVWVAHFRERNGHLSWLLETAQALSHPFIVAELACGTPPAPRDVTLRAIDLLPRCRQASLSEVVDLIERERLYGQGCGLIDICLLVSVLLTPEGKLWTLDKRLDAMAERFGVAYRAGLH